MKNFNIFGVHGKDRILGGEEGGLSKKGGLGQFVDLREGAWQERGDGVFEGVIPQCTLCISKGVGKGDWRKMT